MNGEEERKFTRELRGLYCKIEQRRYCCEADLILNSTKGEEEQGIDVNIKHTYFSVNQIKMTSLERQFEAAYAAGDIPGVVLVASDVEGGESLPSRPQTDSFRQVPISKSLRAEISY
jgi:hypothetical protein